MQSIRSRAIALSTGLAVTGALALAGTASAATDPVVTAIKGQSKVLKSSAGLQDLHDIKINTPAEAKKYLPAFKLLVTKLDHAATVVSHASAPTATDKRGQKDWVAGVRDAARGFGEFEGAITDIEHDDKTAARSVALKAEKPIIAGAGLLVKGEKLLGIISGSTTTT